MDAPTECAGEIAEVRGEVFIEFAEVLNAWLGNRVKTEFNTERV